MRSYSYAHNNTCYPSDCRRGACLVLVEWKSVCMEMEMATVLAFHVLQVFKFAVWCGLGILLELQLVC